MASAPSRGALPVFAGGLRTGRRTLPEQAATVEEDLQGSDKTSQIRCWSHEAPCETRETVISVFLSEVEGEDREG